MRLGMRSRKRHEEGRSPTLAPLQKRALYAVTALLWLSGAVWLGFSLWQKTFALESETFSAQPLLLEIHGAAAMAFLIVFGTLLPGHLPLGWRRKQERPSGVSLLVACGALIISGWGLYYFGLERLRSATSLVHSAFGICLPLAIGLHVWLVKRKSNEARSRAEKLSAMMSPRAAVRVGR